MSFTYGIDSRSLSLSDTRQNNSVSTPPFVRHSILTFETYAEMVHEGDIDLDPEYQRGQYSTLILFSC